MVKEGDKERRKSATRTIKATVSLRIDLKNGRVGPGKVRLLEQIVAQGSIAAAGRTLGMSYRRAWELIDELNKCFRAPVVRAQTGGKHGGGTVVTTLGLALVAHYREMESKAESALGPHLRELARGAAPRR
jgi:molybdate transport system regulatory protein